MFAVEEMEINSCKDDEDYNDNVEGEVWDKSARVARLLICIVQMWADDITSTLPNKEKASGAFSLRVAGCILSWPGVD